MIPTPKVSLLITQAYLILPKCCIRHEICPFSTSVDPKFSESPRNLLDFKCFTTSLKKEYNEYYFGGVT